MTKIYGVIMIWILYITLSIWTIYAKGSSRQKLFGLAGLFFVFWSLVIITIILIRK